MTELGGEFPGFTLLPGAAGLTTSNLDDIETPARLTARGSAPGFARREGSALSMNVTPDMRLTPLYASLSQRRQDVFLLGVPTVDDTFVIKLPPGMQLKSAPAPARGESPFGYYRVDVQQQPGEIRVHSRVALKVSRVRPAEYAAWQRFCSEVDTALSPRLVVGP